MQRTSKKVIKNHQKVCTLNYYCYICCIFSWVYAHESSLLQNCMKRCGSGCLVHSGSESSLYIVSLPKSRQQKGQAYGLTLRPRKRGTVSRLLGWAPTLLRVYNKETIKIYNKTKFKISKTLSINLQHHNLYQNNTPAYITDHHPSCAFSPSTTPPQTPAP